MWRAVRTTPKILTPTTDPPMTYDDFIPKTSLLQYLNKRVKTIPGTLKTPPQGSNRPRRKATSTPSPPMPKSEFSKFVLDFDAFVWYD